MTTGRRQQGCRGRDGHRTRRVKDDATLSCRSGGADGHGTAARVPRARRGRTVGPRAGGRGGGPRFTTHTIATELAGGYQPVVVDLNRDGRPDVIALSTRLDELAWYENPGWERHVLTTGLNRAINAAARDLDGDGIPELVVAHEFGTTHDRSLGVLSLLTHPGDPTEPWRIREIDRTPTVHRVRWADVDGSGAQRADQRPPLRPRRGGAGVPRRGAPLLVPARRLGAAHRARRRPGGGARPAGEAVAGPRPRRRPEHELRGGAPAPVHRRGVDRQPHRRRRPGPVAPQRRERSRDRASRRRDLVTTIEPWHGDQVVVYREDGEAWTRRSSTASAAATPS